jgi:hypothetical protein
MAKKDKNAEAAEDGAASAGIRLSAHPRARRHIAIAKGWGGLIAFAVVLKLARGAGLRGRTRSSAACSAASSATSRRG